MVGMFTILDGESAERGEHGVSGLEDLHPAGAHQCMYDLEMAVYL